MPIDNGVYNLYTSIMINNTMFNPNQLPDPTKLCFTQGVLALKGKGFTTPQEDYLFETVLANVVINAYNQQPDTCTNGGNDKRFFTATFRGTKFFVAENEVNGLTIMLPEEY